MPKKLNMRDVAVLEIDGLIQPGTAAFPTEIALAFGGGQPTRAWLVRPESDWRKPVEGDGELGSGLGHRPETVYREIAAAAADCQVFAEVPMAVAAYMKRMAKAAGEEPIKIGSLQRVAQTVGGKDDRNVGFAGETAYNAVPPSERAASIALRHVTFLEFLAVRNPSGKFASYTEVS